MKTICGCTVAFLLFIGSANTLAQVPEPLALSFPTLPKDGRVPSQLKPPARSAGEAPGSMMVPSSSRLSAGSVSSPGNSTAALTFLVTTANDTGAGSLRKAIEDANGYPGSDVIQFQLPGGTYVIRPQSQFPSISDPVTIDGTTAIGYAGYPLVQIDGSQAGPSHGFDIAAAGCTIRGLAITRFSGSGIFTTGASTAVEACFIGVDIDGVTAAGNTLDGIAIYSANNRIGREAAAPNLISGNGRDGISIMEVSATGNVVVHSYIGTNYSADRAIPNGLWGIHILNASDAIIGGTTPAAQNILSGNRNAGIGIRGGAARNIIVRGNYIGTGADSRVAIPNEINGIEIATNGLVAGSPSNILIGGKANSGEQNVISGNFESGVAMFLDGLSGTGIVVAGNLIGVDESAAVAVPNPIGVYVSRQDTTGAMPGVRLGGVRADSSNIISGNAVRGIWINGPGARNNDIRGNYVGVTPGAGSTFERRPNLEIGIALSAPANAVGGTDLLVGNVIGANPLGGVFLLGPNAHGNVITNNYIGTGPGDTKTIGNGFNGVYIEDASGNTIGRINAGNIVAYNAESGIFVLSGDKNSLRGNSLYRNGTMGIDLSPMMLTWNDTTDADTGPNALVNYPIIDKIELTTTQTIIGYRIFAEARKEYTVDFYTIDTLSASLFGEGKTYLGTQKVTTDTAGRATATLTLASPVLTNLHVTAMATDPDGNSSEFCRAMCLEDTDGDGIYDCWETDGIGMDIDMNGLVDLNLFARGASPRHKDLFIEVDRMEGYYFDSLARVMAEKFFATAPNALVNNPDGKDGISLHLTYLVGDTTIASAPWPDPPWVQFHAAKKSRFGTDLERAHPNGKTIIEAKRQIYRYCVFADRYGNSGSSGLAEKIHANDFIVTLGNWAPVGGTRAEQAGTFVHELGHTLGLRHGGGDNVNYKPNYLSVMNYLWQFPGAAAQLNNNLTWKIIYSPTALDALNESNLNEKAGLNVPKGKYPGAIVVYGTSAKGYRRGKIWPNTAIDWDGNRDSSGLAGIAVDLNGLDQYNAPNQTLVGFADWPVLKYNFRSSATYPDPAFGTFTDMAYDLGDEPEMTPAMYDSIKALPPFGLIPAYLAPSIQPDDTSAIGGNSGLLKMNIGEPVPAGGQRYYFQTSEPGLISVSPGSVLAYEGTTEFTFEFTTRGVDRDTLVTIRVDSLDVPVSASVIIHPASLIGLRALGDSGCVVTEPGGFKKRFLAGCTILLEAALDGEAPQAGDIVHLASSRPDLINPPAQTPVDGFARSGFIPVRSTKDITGAQVVVLTATYRGQTHSDTVIIMPAPAYTVKQIGSTYSDATGPLKINNAGDVLVNHSMLYRNDTMVPFTSLPGFSQSLSGTLLGLNDLGWVCGQVWDTTTQRSVAAYWRPDTTIVLPSLSAAYPTGAARAINNLGDVIGFCEAANYPYTTKPVIWRNNVPQELPGYSQFLTDPTDINDAGEGIGTGYYYSSRPYVSKRVALRWANGVVTAVDDVADPYYWMEGVAIAANGTGLVLRDPSFWFYNASLSTVMGPPPTFSRLKAYDMNDSLEVVGSMTKYEGEGVAPNRAFVLRGGYQYDLTCLAPFPPTWSDFSATSINNSGTIVGWARSEGQIVYFMLTPTSTNGVTEPEMPKPLPTAFVLMQNYPNPFNPTTMIRYALPYATDVQLEVFTILGQRVRTLVDSRQPAGEYEVRLDASSLATGVYFYRLRAGQFTQVQKMMLMK